ncbi:MAG: CHASE domain-containing protein, partial [Bacteroidetes bacterium]|nr:CHASE domain-containing protein [Bacteroidota bacterium]
MNNLKLYRKNNSCAKSPGLKSTVFRNRFAISLLVLITSLTASLIIWNISNTNVKNELRSYFEFRVRDVNTRIYQRLNSYEQILRSVRGLYVASYNVDRTEFNSFFNSLRLNENYPGIQGVGFSLIILKEQIKKHTAAFRKEGFPEYKLWPEGEREIYTSIIYLEPFKDRNLRAFGYDMFSEPVRRKAMEAARDSNEAAISGKIKLVQETGKENQAGFLIYLPVYKNGILSTTLNERRKNIIGWVYSPFRMGDFMEGLLGERAADLDVEIYDGKIVSNETQMYDSQTPSTEIKPPLTSGRLMNLNGHEWTVVIKSTPKLESRIESDTTRIILIVGISISILLTIITWLVEKKRMLIITANTERKHNVDVIEKTNKELTKLNAEKDKFFSIIAHDLKSPFQGLIGMTELMADDTEIFSPAEFIEHSKSLNETAHNMYKLLEYLLEWAQVQNGTINFMPKDFELSGIVSQSIESIYQRALHKRITVINEITNSQKVYADENMIGSVLRNILSNAVKFTKTGGKV